MVTKAKKSQLVVIRQTPYGNSLARASLDVVLAAAAFEFPVSVLFFGEGVLQLLAEQDSTKIDSRNISKLIASLPLYDVDTLYVDSSALTRYAINADDLPQAIEVLDEAAIGQLLNTHDHVLGF